MNVDIKYDLTELNKKAKYCLELSDLTEEETLDILKHIGRETSYVELITAAYENKEKGNFKDANKYRIR